MAKSSHILKFEGTRITREGGDENLGTKGAVHRVRTCFLLRDVEQIDVVGDTDALFGESMEEEITFVVLRAGPIYLADSFDVVNAAWDAYLNRRDLPPPPAPSVKGRQHPSYGQGYGSNF